MAQLEQFKTPTGWLSGSSLAIMLGLVGLVMVIMYLLPKWTKAVPAGLVGIVAATTLTQIFGLETRTVGDIAKIAGGLPVPSFPNVPIAWETLRIVLPYAAILAAIGLIETLMTLNLIDEMTETRGRPNKECVAQGVANVTAGVLRHDGRLRDDRPEHDQHQRRGPAPALRHYRCPLPARIRPVRLVRDRTDSRSRPSSGSCSWSSIGTFEWASFKMLRKVPRSDAFVIIFVTVVTLVSDLAIAVIAGVIVSALVFAWESAKKIQVEVKDLPTGVREYDLHGALFFGSTNRFRQLFSPGSDPQEVIIDFADSRVFDHSGIEAIQNLAESYRTAGKTLHLRHLSADCRSLLHKARDMVEVNYFQDPTYKVADDELD